MCTHRWEMAPFAVINRLLFSCLTKHRTRRFLRLPMCLKGNISKLFGEVTLLLVWTFPPSVKKLFHPEKKPRGKGWGRDRKMCPDDKKSRENKICRCNSWLYSAFSGRKSQFKLTHILSHISNMNRVRVYNYIHVLLLKSNRKSNLRCPIVQLHLILNDLKRSSSMLLILKPFYQKGVELGRILEFSTSKTSAVIRHKSM